MTELLTLVDGPAAVRVSLALVHFLWQGAALAGLALLLLAALRKAPAGTRYLALLAVLAAMTLCPVATFVFAGRAPAAPVFVPAAIPASVLAAPPAALPAANQAPAMTGRIASAAAATRPMPHAAPAPRLRLADLSGRLRPVLPWVSVLWLVGVVALSLRLLLRWWALRRVGRGLRPADPQWEEMLRSLSRQLRLSRLVRLMVSAAAQVPMVLGWLRPVVVLPASALTGLSADQLAALLAHELAHLRRHDHWANLLQTVVELLLFYHPAVWWLSRALRAEREHCCDDIAVALSGDAPSYMRALAWVEEHRGAHLRPALAASGSPLLRRIRRLAGLPAPAEVRPAWLAAALSLAMAVAIPLTGAISRAAAPDESGHQPGLRDQWQPQTEHDARLAQPMRIEILGRAAVPALEMLSKETGVTLQVAPENLETVGDRKLTIIAQGCSLKSIMVQIPNALQECHWDVDVTGPQPAYLLHRDGGAEATIVELVTEARLPGRLARQARLDAARLAMAMSPEELAEVAKTDPMLAAAVKDPVTRRYLEAMFALPEPALNQLVMMGGTSVEYATAPASLQQRLLDWLRSECTREAGGDAQTLAEMESFIASLPGMVISFEQAPGGGLASSIWNPRKGGVSGSPGFPDRLASSPRYRGILLGAGMTEQDADALLLELAKQSDRQEAAERDRRRAEWREPRSPELHREVVLPFKGEVGPAEVQRFVAKETGLSLVSDYFTAWIPQAIPAEAEAPAPIWRLLYLLGETWFWTYDWNQTDDCLVFHDRYWYRQTLQELPEPLVVALREKLKQQPRLTLDDVAAAAAELQRRRPLPLSLRDLDEWQVSIPSDLLEAGLWLDLRSEVLLLHASLSPEQKAKARRPEGLPYAEMTATQRALVRPYAFLTGGGHATMRRFIPPEGVSQAVYHIETVGEAGSGQKAQTRPRLAFPSIDLRW